MALTLTPSPYQTVLDSDGNPVSGAKITTSTSGTTDALSTYTTAVGDVANANPIVADSAGRFVAYLSAGASYRFTITDASDVAIDTQDGIGSVPGSSVNLDITGTAGEAIAAGEVCYISGGDGSKTAGLWYLADADNAYSSTTAVEIGMAVSAIVINTAGTIRLAGEATTATSTVVGTTYYVSATAGAITSSAPALSRLVGIAPTTSSLILNANTLTIPVVVSQGGTGKTTLTAYGVLLGGTTTTAAVQPLTPAAAGQILKSGGTGAVAAWTDDPSVASITLADLTASVATFTDGSKTLVSNAITGSGNVVMSASPTMTGTIGAAALTLSTPLVVGSGGTGLSAAGSSGNVLTSDGSVWASSTPAAGFEPLNICEGRLTLTSATPVTSADVSGATTLYWAPYAGNKVALYDGSSWSVSTFTQRSISLSGLTASKPYDVWVYDNSGTITLELLVWTNDTTRATAIVLQDGVWCKTGALTRRYLGTLYVDSGGGAVTSTLAIRHLWNYYNRCPLPLFRMDTTNSWTYTVAAWRQANASTANQFDFIIGVAEVPVIAELKVQGYNSSADVATYVGLGLDSTTAPTSGNFTTCNPASSPSAGQEFALSSAYSGYPAAGRHYLAWLENSTASGTMTWDGDAGGSKRNSGMTGVIDG